MLTHSIARIERRAGSRKEARAQCWKDHLACESGESSLPSEYGYGRIAGDTCRYPLPMTTGAMLTGECVSFLMEHRSWGSQGERKRRAHCLLVI